MPPKNAIQNLSGSTTSIDPFIAAATTAPQGFSAEERFEALLELASGYLNEDELALLKRAFAFASEEEAKAALRSAAALATSAPATSERVFSVLAFMGVPSTMGSSFRTRVTTSDVPSDFFIVQRPGYFAFRSINRIVRFTSTNWLGAVKRIIFGYTFDVRKYLFDLIYHTEFHRKGFRHIRSRACSAAF